MKTPTNRSAYMDELRSILEDVLTFGHAERSWFSRKYIASINGRDMYIDYTEEDAPQLIEFKHYARNTVIRVEYNKDALGLAIYVDGEYMLTLEFEQYKNKTSYAAAVAVWVANYAC